MDRIAAPSAPNPRREPEPGRTVDLPVFWLEPAESDVDLRAAGLVELKTQSAAARIEGWVDTDDPEEMVGVEWWPPLRDRLTDQFTKAGPFAEPKLKAPSPPLPPTLLAGGLDGAVVPPERDDAATPARRANKPPKAASVGEPSASPEERHKRAVLALVDTEPRGAAQKRPIDPIDEADLETCRSALRAVRDAVYGVGVDDVKLSAWSPATTAQTLVWLLNAPLLLERSAEVHDALAEFGLDVHEDNEALVAYAEGAGVMLVGADDLDWPGERSAADEGGEE